MPSIAARIGLGRVALLVAIVVAAIAGPVLLAGGKSVRERDRAQNVIVLDGTAAATSGPAATATASNGITDVEANQAYVESRDDVEHKAAIAPEENTASMAKAISPGAPSDAEVRRQLKILERGGPAGVAGARARLLPSGMAQAPFSAPDRVARVIAGGNQIAKFPYIWGGGHGSFRDNGYDCSGSVSYALKAGGLLKAPMVSGAFARYGKPGPGRWITIYANGGHIFMVVAGLRYDTSGRSGPRGSRWQTAPRSTAGFVVRHPPGL
jgi:cell wall-associated NlpC family hydrolase